MGEEKKKVEQELELDVKEFVASIKEAVSTAVVEAVREIKPEEKPKEESIVGKPVLQPWSKEEVKERLEAIRAKAIERWKKNTEIPEDEFSFMRLIRAQITGNWDEAPFERFALEAARNNFSSVERTLTSGTGSAGGYWVPAEYLPEEFVTYFTANVVLRKAGCLVINAKSTPVNIPKITGGATVNWVGEGSAITASDQTAAQIQMTPKFAVARSKISEMLVMASAPSAESIVREDIARSLAVEVDQEMLNGDGTSNNPTGLASTSGINTVAIGTNGGALTMDILRNMLYELELDNVPSQGIIWIFHPRTWSGICKFQDSNGQYYINPNRQDAETKQLFGYPVYTTTNLRINLTKGTGTNLAEMFCVNVKDVILCEWGGIALKATDVGGDAWANNLIEVKGTYAMDCAVRHPESVCYLSDSTT